MSASSQQPAAPEAALCQAGDLGRRHGRAAVYWQIGDSDSGREFYRELLDGIASADPAITGLFAVPDLTARWDYERENLAADLGQLDVHWDSGSTLSMLLDEGDRVRLVTPAPGAGTMEAGKEPGR